ncbi:hypothetical protein NCAS_0E00350 [Naumovozyma castellii]|uniref:ER membrane protein complex subunit 4 n=1 Tax=Naumovozyma castellii TaxID=27288 RepID=G0VF40_NAUCA|nr:hypothetical protein NCAS_0E00350 [Naumovozyma castellii CBS 4309]CCC70105.1 hypothetical protein NCAS_0E00350 [Naumovozyma castellii CBS 4309]
MSVEPFEWAVKLCNLKEEEATDSSAIKTLPSPPGYGVVEVGKNQHESQGNKATEAIRMKELNNLLAQKAMSIAMQPAKSIPMNMIMSYMSGTSLQIIPIMAALMLLSGPLKAIFSIRAAFKPVLGNKEIQSQVNSAMFLYIVFQGALMYIGIRKLNAMGLIPNTKSDWLTWELPVDYNIGRKVFAF